MSPTQETKCAECPGSEARKAVESSLLREVDVYLARNRAASTRPQFEFDPSDNLRGSIESEFGITDKQVVTGLFLCARNRHLGICIMGSQEVSTSTVYL